MDDYGGEKSVQKKHQMTYEQAFIARFGTPSPNLDWGFGSNTAATTRSLNSNSMAYSSKAITRAATSTAESNWTLTEGYTATFNDAEMQASERNTEFMRLRKEITDAPANPIEQKLDRIIELLEGTLETKQKGIDFSANPWWDRFLDK